jgi:hypothetical protein
MDEQTLDFLRTRSGFRIGVEGDGFVVIGGDGVRGES